MRSLTKLRAQTIESQLSINDWDTDLNNVHPLASAVHYTDPVVYNEMLQMIGKLEMRMLLLSLLLCWFIILLLYFNFIFITFLIFRCPCDFFSIVTLHSLVDAVLYCFKLRQCIALLSTEALIQIKLKLIIKSWRWSSKLRSQVQLCCYFLFRLLGEVFVVCGFGN
jgi:hypothetical protein